MTVLVSSFPFDKVLNVNVCKLIISRINKKAPMNVIICSPQGNVHMTRQTNITSSIVSRLSRVSDLSSLTSSISMISRSKCVGRKAGVKNRSKVQRIVDELVNCGSPNQQLKTLKEVLRNPDLRQTNELISSSTTNSSCSFNTANTLNQSPLLFDLMTQFKISGSQARRTLISKAGIYGKIDNNVFCKSDKGRELKSRATNSIIDSVLNVGSHKQQDLALNNALKHPKLIDQAADCGCFWKESEKIHSAMSIIERQASILQVATNCKNQGRKTDDKQLFVNSYFVSISNGIELKNKSVNKITKLLSLPRSTGYRVFSKCDEIIKKFN